MPRRVVADIDKDVVLTFDNGGGTVGTSSQQVSSSDVPTRKGVRVLAHPDNTGRIAVGKSDVTYTSADATDGYILVPGDSILVPAANVNLVYVIGSATGQMYRWITA